MHAVNLIIIWIDDNELPLTLDLPLSRLMASILDCEACQLQPDDLHLDLTQGKVVDLRKEQALLRDVHYLNRMCSGIFLFSSSFSSCFLPCIWCSCGGVCELSLSLSLSLSLLSLIHI